ncbi:hypothetical protein GCM10010211_76520 [Streptomyces albospinus]|uniref:Uncharacterized protein n=1 Tax=Streptomyces albospinus TaxID=285515 RepID=A0ABQ2VPE6_9ACTN|nr:hypothetical protein GCM10010211_76520 [Streptomyces albospinus]
MTAGRRHLPWPGYWADAEWFCPVDGLACPDGREMEQRVAWETGPPTGWRPIEDSARREPLATEVGRRVEAIVVECSTPFYEVEHTGKPYGGAPRLEQQHPGATSLPQGHNGEAVIKKYCCGG